MTLGNHWRLARSNCRWAAYYAPRHPRLARLYLAEAAGDACRLCVILWRMYNSYRRGQG